MNVTIPLSRAANGAVDVQRFIRVFVADEVTRQFLEQIHRQCSFDALAANTNYCSLFRHSNLDFVVYADNLDEYNDSYKERHVLTKSIEETIDQLTNLKDDAKFSKKLKHIIINRVKHIKYWHFDPFHLDIINRYVQLIVNVTTTMAGADLKRIVKMLFVKFKHDLDLFGADADLQQRNKRLRKHLITAVQTSNSLQLNTCAFSVGYVRKHAHVETNEFLINEIRSVQSYLFDPVNIYLIKKQLDQNDVFDKNELQQVLNNTIDTNANTMIKLCVRYKQNQVELNYPSCIFAQNVVVLSHNAFCNDHNCHFEEFYPSETCFFNELKKHFDNTTKPELDYCQKYTLGFVEMIQTKRLNLLLHVELLQRFHYMELFLKYRFACKYPVHEHFEYENYSKAIEFLDKNATNPFIVEMNEYNRMQFCLDSFDYDPFIHMIVPDLSCRTAAHTLIRKSKFELFTIICTQTKIDILLDKIKDVNSVENRFLMSMFQFLEAFNQITLYDLISYIDIMQNINRADFEKLTTTNKVEFKTLAERLQDVLRQVRENLRTMSITMLGALKAITFVNSDQSSDTDEDDDIE